VKDIVVPTVTFIIKYVKICYNSLKISFLTSTGPACMLFSVSVVLLVLLCISVVIVPPVQNCKKN